LESRTVTEHPSFRNPQIAEALCEIHYTLAPGTPWRPTAPGAFFKELQSDYPELEPMPEQGVVLVFGPDGVPVQHLTPPRIKFKLKHGTRPFLLQISEQTLSLNVLPPYPGWSGFKSELAHRWPNFVKTVNPQAITRIGLRYINRIARRSADEKPSYWLKSSEYVAAITLKSGPGFLARSESRLDSHNRLLVTVAHDTSHHGGGIHGSLLLDLDRIIEKEIRTEWQEIEATIQALHDSVWEVFSAACGKNLEKLLKGEVKNA
jgi:uncharacterized protein (TIGR04255 family)